MSSVIRAAGVTLVLSTILLLGPPAAAATRYDPRLQFRTVRTAHFDIHAHQGEEALAARLAAIAERVRARLEPELGAPHARVHVILVDQADIANGWATPFPYDAIEIVALPPASDSLIGNTPDWLDVVFAHEYTHIVHLDRTRGWMRAIRGVFGRVPVAFPNMFLPVWQVEGLATFEESRQSGEGRVGAGDFRVIVDAAARRGRFEPRDRASGGLIDWPSGQTPYAYGALFHQYLADRYGADSIRALADATAGRVPFFGAGAFSHVFGSSVGRLWDDFGDAHAAAAVTPSRTDAAATRLTRDGFEVTGLRMGDDGALYFERTDAGGFPSLMRLDREGRPSRLAWRYAGNRTAVRDGWVVFDQVHFVRSVALYSDLYAVQASGGAVRALTHDARAGDPDISPDGRHIACTVETAGRHALALLDFEPAGPPALLRLFIDDSASDFGAPRWSPDGRAIAAVRRHDGSYELTVIDAATRDVRVLTRGPRVAAPSWTADGRTILVAAAPGAEPFNVFAVDAASGAVRRVTDSASGARMPELSRDGRSLVYVGYTPDGSDLFRVPVDRASWQIVDPRTFRTDAGATSSGPPMAQRAAPYSPWRTLRPTYWTPVVATDAGEAVVGAGTAMADVLGRHAYAADAAWSASRARPDWNLSYAYDRWRPTLFAAYSDDTDPVQDAEVRARELIAGLLLPFRTIRRTNTLLAAFDATADRVACAAPCRVRLSAADRRAGRGGWLFDSRRAYGYSISTEEGAEIELAAEAGRAGGRLATGTALADLRGYHRVFRSRTVLAVRGAAAVTWGDLDARRAFSASGPGPSVATLGFDRDAIGLLRGFAADAVLGSRAAVLNADLRFPLVRIQRGAGSWPVFLRTLHAAIFGDAGQAWDGPFRMRDTRLSSGGELSLDLVLGHYLPVTFTAGAAWTHDPSRPSHDAAAAFGRIGHAF
jgi:hypothetical protein